MDYRVTVKVQNNNILRRIYDAGFKSVSDFCNNNDNKKIHERELGQIINMKKSPFNKDGDFSQIVKSCADILLCLPEDLFSENQLTAELENNVKQYEVSEEDLRFMLQNNLEQRTPEQLTYDNEKNKAVEEALNLLTPREKKVISMRFGLSGLKASTLREVSKCFDVTPERIRAIETKALRKLRHPKFAHLLSSIYKEEVI